MKSIRIAVTISLCASFTSCASRDPAAAARAGTNHPLALGAREWSAQLETKEPAPKGLIWRAPGKPKGVLLCLHGIQTHAAWFGPLAAELNKAGWTVIAPDRRGSGVNSAPPFAKGDIESRSRLECDLERQLRQARQEAGKGGRLLLLGTSWGANQAGDHVVRATDPAKRLTRPDALVLLVPNAALRNDGLGQMLRTFLTRRLPFKDVHYLKGQAQTTPPGKPAKEGEPPSNTSEGKADIDWKMLQHDRKHGILLTQPGYRTFNAGRAFQKNWAKAASSVNVPVLVLLARHDQIMDNSAAKALYPEPLLESGKVTVRELDGGHAIQLTAPRAIAGEIESWAAARQ